MPVDGVEGRIVMKLRKLFKKHEGLERREYGVVDQPPTGAESRLLVTIDYAYQPCSIGDLLVNLFAAIVVAAEHGVLEIDFCFISGPDRIPADPNMQKVIGRDTRWVHLFSILPVIQLLPGLGSVMVFDSLEMFRRHLAANPGRYHLWPSLEQLERHAYLYYPGLTAIDGYYNRHSRLPKLNFYKELVEWTASFYARLVYPALPVTVNLRNNKLFHQHRNSDVAAWKGLFDYCNGRYPVTFVITCALAEVAEELRACPNVLFAKDQHTTIVQDLALIRHSIFHIGASSGPSILPVFYSTPYFISNCDALPHIQHYGGTLLQAPDGSLRFSFAGELQRLGIDKETSEGLIREFERIWYSRSEADWREAALVHPDAASSPTQMTWLA